MQLCIAHVCWLPLLHACYSEKRCYFIHTHDHKYAELETADATQRDEIWVSCSGWSTTMRAAALTLLMPPGVVLVVWVMPATMPYTS